MQHFQNYAPHFYTHGCEPPSAINWLMSSLSKPYPSHYAPHSPLPGRVRPSLGDHPADELTVQLVHLKEGSGAGVRGQRRSGGGGGRAGLFSLYT